VIIIFIYLLIITLIWINLKIYAELMLKFMGEGVGGEVSTAVEMQPRYEKKIILRRLISSNSLLIYAFGLRDCPIENQNP